MTQNTIIEIYKNIPLNKDSEDTLLFSTRDEQSAYFSGLTENRIQRSEALPILRDNISKFRIQGSFTELEKANYLRFINPNLSRKYFYAFIDRVNYVSDNCAEIEYTIDVMQTWLAGVDYNLTECRILRQHQTGADEIGDNIEPENIQISEYGSKVIEVQSTGAKYYEEYNPFSAGYYIALAFPNTVTGSSLFYYYDGEGATTHLWGGTNESTFPIVQIIDKAPCGNFIALFDASSENSVAQMQTVVSTWGSKLLSTWVIPKAILDEKYISTDWKLSTGSIPETASVALSVKCLFYATVDGSTVTRTGDIDAKEVIVPFKTSFTYLPDLETYEVKNKKLFTNPFSFYEITAPNGATQKLNFELMDASKINASYVNHKPYIKIIASLLDTRITAIPMGYNGKEYGFDKQLGLPQPPTGVTVTEGNGNAHADIMQSIISLGSTAAGAIAGGPVGLAVTGGSALAGLCINNTTLPQGSGSVYNLSNLGLWANNVRSFVGSFRYPLNYEAIDNYFEAYGYTQNKIAVPDITHRSLWTYVQTENAQFEGVDIPANALSNICKKFNSGIRFHRNAYTIRHLTNYTNSIII